MKIVIPGKPIPKKRARHANRGSFVVTYDPQDRDKRIVKNLITEQLHDYANSSNKLDVLEMARVCSANIFSVYFIFFLPVNASDSVIQRNRKLWGITKATTKPDYDNLEKFYLDCANGILWGDDASVIQGKAIKLYSEEPRVEIIVNAVENIRLNTNVEKVVTQFSPSEFKEMQEYAKKIAEISLPDMEGISGNILQEWAVSTACLLSEFSLLYSNKLTKIAKLGDVNSEVRKEKEMQLELKI